MGMYVVNRPDEAALRRAMEAHVYDMVGAAIRLAWLGGLLRSEIVALEWDSVSFLNREIELPGHRAPLCDELYDYLLRLMDRQPWQLRRVLLSDARRRPMQPQSVSTAVRSALDEVGQTGVRLLDLRYDFMLRQLAEHDWQYVSGITGVEALAMRLHFSEYLPENAISMKIENRNPAPEAAALRQLLQDEGTSVAGRTLRLVWQGGLNVDDIAVLTWGQVDTDACVLHLPGGDVPVTEALAAYLSPLRAAADAPVVISPRSGRDMRADRLSRVARAALVSAGLRDLSLRDLQKDAAARSGGEETLAHYVRQHGHVTRAEAASLLGVSEAVAYRRLLRLTERGDVVRVGARYYTAETTVAPERQYAVIRNFLEREGVACRQDIAEMLGVEPRQCTFILKRLVEKGRLVREKQRYRLPDTE